MAELTSQDISKVLDKLIGKTWAIDETHEDKKRTANLRTLIDITDYCLDWLLISVELQGNEYSIVENRELAREAMFKYMEWFNECIFEKLGYCTENKSFNMLSILSDLYDEKGK